MKVDVDRARVFLGDKPLDLRSISMIRKVLNSRSASWFVEKTMGQKMSHKEKQELLRYLEQQEKILKQQKE